MEKVRLYNGRGDLCSLSNVCFMHRCDAIELEVRLKQTKTASKMCEVASKMTDLDWEVFYDGEDEAILRWVDTLGNKKYIRAMKEVQK